MLVDSENRVLYDWFWNMLETEDVDKIFLDQINVEILVYLDKNYGVLTQGIRGFRFTYNTDKGIIAIDVDIGAFIDYVFNRQNAGVGDCVDYAFNVRDSASERLYVRWLRRIDGEFITSDEMSSGNRVENYTMKLRYNPAHDNLKYVVERMFQRLKLKSS